MIPATMSNAEEPGEASGLSQEHDSEDHRADCSHPDPHAVGGADRMRLHADAQKAETPDHRQDSQTVGHNRAKPSVYFSPMAQPTSKRPATARIVQAMTLLSGIGVLA
jgi:hypothetical protein